MRFFHALWAREFNANDLGYEISPEVRENGPDASGTLAMGVVAGGERLKRR